jgi:biopolymer transport protein TolR
MSEINVTPFVDVMLVLLIVFMITAPMLTSGVTVDLPKTKAESLPASDDQPLVVTIDKSGNVYVGGEDTPVQLDALPPLLIAVAREDLTKRVFIRGDENVSHGRVIAVLSLLQQAGFRNAAMVVDAEAARRLQAAPVQDGG